jgi:hypothetical protein
MIQFMFIKFLHLLVFESGEMEFCTNLRFINFLDFHDWAPDAKTLWSLVSGYLKKQSQEDMDAIPGERYHY